MPIGFTVFNGKLYFSANDGADGRELWVTDGTAGGTALVNDINAGYLSSNPQDLTVFDGKLFFQADNGVNGPELWSSDGTSVGTQLVNDIFSGSTGSYPQGFTAYSGKLFFAATDSLHGTELWVTDGTNLGTTLLADLNPGYNSSNPAYFTIYHNKLYFSGAPDSVSGAQLFVTDGTVPGTQGLIFNGAPLNPLDATNGFTVFDNNLAFGAYYDGVAGQQLWFFNDAPTAVKQIEATTSFTLYPNPCHNYYTVNGFNPGETYTIRVTDLTGRILYEELVEPFSQSMQFVEPPFSAGIYLLQVQNGRNISTLRMVKN